MYTAAAVFGGRAMPGRRKTQMWEKGFWVGSVKRNEVGDGAEEGVVMQGLPVGIWRMARLSLYR